MRGQLECWQGGMLVIYSCICLAIVFFDLKKMIIPDELSFLLIVIGLGARLFNGDFLDGLYGVALGFGIYFAIRFVSGFIFKRETLGLGDCKLGAGIGAVWGSIFVIYTIYLSFIIGALLGGILLALSFKKRQDTLPFGPMMIAASFLILVLRLI